MKNIQYYIVLVFAGILLASCQKEIEFSGEYTEPLVVVNSYLIPESTVQVHLSKSRFFLDNKRGFDWIENAVVEITINGDSTETLSHSQQGFYIGNYRPQAGDSISLNVQVPGFDDITSTTVVQPKSNIISVDTIAKKLVDRYPSYYIDDEVVGYSAYYEYEIGIRIKDPEAVKNYYRLTVKQRGYSVQDSTQFYEYNLYFTLKGVSSETTSSVFEEFMENTNNDEHVFNDELFNGKESVLQFTYGNSQLEVVPGKEEYFEDYGFTNNNPYDLIINLQSTNRDSYLYFKTKMAAEQVFETVFTEPVQIHTNITNGVGIFGTFTDHKVVLRNR